ncbi:hypothetical protein ACG3SL_09680 [Sphingomonas sp. CJ20]
MSPLQAVKWWIVTHVDLAKDALHIYVGLALFLGSAWLFRDGVRNWKPLAVVMAAALAGEMWDLRDSLVYHTPIHPWGNVKDICNTMFWPLAIATLARTTSLFAVRT